MEGLQNSQDQTSQEVVPTLGAILGGANNPPAQEPNQQQGGEAPQQNQGWTNTGPPMPDPNAPVVDPNAAATSATPDSGTEGQSDITLLLSADENSLSTEDRQLRETVYSTFGAVNVDSHGNLLNAEGKVVLSADNLDKYIDTGEVLTDAKGNQIDEAGNILKPASELVNANTLVELSRQNFEKEYGYSLLDAEGKPKVYSNSVEGSSQLLKDVADNATINAVSSFLTGNPQVKDIYFHLANGGTLEDYTSSNVDYGSLDLTDMSKEAKLHYIKQSFERQGLKNSASIMKTLEMSSEETITSTAADAIITLKQISEEKAVERENAYKAQQLAQEQEVDKYWNEVSSVIKGGKIKDITIPDAEKDGFFKYLAVPINSKGESQEMLDVEEEDTDFNLMISYLRYKKYDLSKLVTARAKVNKLDELRNRVGVSNPKIENAQARTNGNRATDVGIPTLAQITKMK